MTANNGRIEKRRVRMVMQKQLIAENGEIYTGHYEAVDYVPVEILDAYVADAKTRWPIVDVGTEHDPGPAGDTGATVVPESMRSHEQ